MFLQNNLNLIVTFLSCHYIMITQWWAVDGYIFGSKNQGRGPWNLPRASFCSQEFLMMRFTSFHTQACVAMNLKSIFWVWYTHMILSNNFFDDWIRYLICSNLDSALLNNNISQLTTNFNHTIFICSLLLIEARVFRWFSYFGSF